MSPADPRIKHAIGAWPRGCAALTPRQLLNLRMVVKFFFDNTCFIENNMCWIAKNHVGDWLKTHVIPHVGRKLLLASPIWLSLDVSKTIVSPCFSMSASAFCERKFGSTWKLSIRNDPVWRKAFSFSCSGMGLFSGHPAYITSDLQMGTGRSWL